MAIVINGESSLVNVTAIDDTPIAAGAGNCTDGTPRVTIAGDDANIAAIKVAIQLIDDIIAAGVAKANVTTIAGVAPSVAGKFDIKAADADLVGVGATTDSASTVGGTGSLNAKSRLLTTLIDAIKTSVELRSTKVENTWTQLTAPGTTATVSTIGVYHHTVQYVIASINANIVARVEGSLDGTSWFNLDDQGYDITVVSNGTYMVQYDGLFKYVRFNFVSESGGTAATIDAKYLGGN